MYKDKQILAIIPARGGSKRIPRKNIRELAGKPLIAYTIEQAKRSKYLDKVVVSTEDKEITEISEKYGAKVLNRPRELAEDDTPSLPVFQHAIEYLEEKEGFNPDIIVILQPTSPLREVIDIDNAIDKLFETNADSIVSVCEAEHSPYWMYKLKDGDKISPFINSRYLYVKRQNLPKVYWTNGAIYVTKRNTVMKENKILGKDTRALIMPYERSVDIDTELDFKFAEFLIKNIEINEKSKNRK